MKKIFYSLLFCLLIFSLIFVYEVKSSYRVFKIVSPVEIFIDFNKNDIFDEKSPYIVNNIFYIDKNKDLSEYSEFSSLSKKEIIFLDYYAHLTSQNLLKNKFVKIKDNNIIINNKKYADLLIKSGYFYDNSAFSRTNLVKKVKTIDLNNYVLYNTKSKKYHSLDCENIYNIKNYKIVKKSFINDKFVPCKNCILNNAEKTDTKKITADFNESITKGCLTVYFLDLNKIMTPSYKCNTSACLALKKEIDGAKYSIDFAIYGIENQSEIFNALVKAKNRGVKIRWVTDFNKKDGSIYKDTFKLQNILPCFNSDKSYDLSNQSAIMHNKFFIFDNQKVFTGSANITSTGLTGFNANYAILINSKQAAEIYKKEFEQMYNGKFHKLKSAILNRPVSIDKSSYINIYFSPQDKIITSKIIPLIRCAKNYIYIPVFFITKKELADELINAHSRGVDVKVINDATNSHTKYSIHKQLRNVGIKVKTENYAGKMHTKAVIIDDKYSIIGSMNLTNSGENKNDENVVIIYDKDIALYMKKTFLYLWNKIPKKYETFDPRAESTESIGSCFDGIDNNYDGKTDKEDEGCKIK